MSSNLSSVDNGKKGYRPSLKVEHLIAGISGGLSATLLLHPLDVIKIRFAVYDGKHKAIRKYSGIYDAFRTIIREEGLVGLYRGVVPNCWGAGSAWGLYFLFYNSLKSRIQQGDTNFRLKPVEHLLAASQAGALTLAITNPIWVVKTRMFLQYSEKNLQYNGMIDALIKIYKSEGIRGYYKGFLPGLFGVSHGAVQFMVYEEMKNQYHLYYNLPISSKLDNIENLCFASMSKIIAAGVTYPYQVVRARLQNQHYSYNGTLDCIRLTWQYEGWRGFYKGLATNLLRVTPATAITFMAYENVSYLFLPKTQTLI